MPLTQNQRRSVDDIVAQIRTGMVIPIIGYDLLFNEFDDNNDEHDFLKFIIKKHAKNDNLESNYKRINSKLKLSGYELVNEYYHGLANKEIFKVELSDTIKEQRFYWNLTFSSYRKLVSIKNFQFFINATFLNGLELAYNAVRAEGSNESEIKSSYRVLNYKSYNPIDIPEPAPPGRDFNIDLEKTIIYNLFGTHDDRKGNYVLTDTDYIELIYDLMVNKEGKFTNLLSYLNGAYLLFLGCNFPDWFFRFFIRICVGNRLDAVSTTKRKAVIDSLNEIDASRSVFINHYGIQKLDIDCNVLVNEIYQSLSNFPGRPDLVDNKFNNNVFISYCRKDEKAARDIASQFKDNYIEYFLDNNEIYTGSNIDGTIKEAIDKCCLFLPIVSSNLSTSTKYFCKEWNYAIDSGKTIIPVYKEFVDQNMFLPCEPNTNIRQFILNKDNKLGIKLDIDNKILEEDLRNIKDRQFNCKVSDKQ